MVNVSHFAPDKNTYVDRFDVSAELEEFGTGRWAGGPGRRGFPLVLTRAPAAVQGWF